MLDFQVKDVIFKSPIFAASGTFGYGDEIAENIDIEKIGCVITKSITVDARKGNPHPRIHQAGVGMLNAIGLANVGVKQFCNKKLPNLNKLKTHYMVSIAGSSMEEYEEVLSQIELFSGNHIGYEINVSCPNVKEGGMEFGLNRNMVYDLTSRLRAITKKLLFVKLSPNVTSIENIAKKAEEAGADGISAVNTFVGLGIDYKTGKFELSTIYGGVSGPPIKPLALARVNKIYNKIKIPIIGMGGISSFGDIVEFIRVGASMVQVGTLNYRDPSVICKYYDDLSKFILDNKISSISDLIGDCR